MTGFAICEPAMIKQHMRPGISKVTIRALTGPMAIGFSVTGAAGVIQGVVIAGAPAGGVGVAGLTTARIMPNRC